MGVFDLEATISLNSTNYKSQLRDAASYTDNTARTLDARTVAIGNVIADLAKKGGEFFVDMAKTGIQYNAQIETYTTALTTALGDEAAAAAAIENIKQDAARTPYSVDGLVKANSYLIAAGESAGDARNTIMALGDAVAATGGGNTELQRMAQNLQQVKNVGKATLMDIKQFQMAGIEVYSLLADYTGKTKEEVQGMTITYDLLAGALQYAAGEGGKFYGAMQRQSETFNGQISTLRDNIQSKLGQAFEGVTNTLSGKVLPKVNEFVSGMNMDKIVAGAGNVAKAIGVIGAALVGQKVAAVVTGWVAAFQAAQVQVSLYSLQVGTAGVAQGALNGQLTIGEVIVAAMTGKISLATAAQSLWNAATAAFPAALIVGALAAIGVGIAKFTSDMADARAAGESFGDSTEEVSARLAELKAQYEAYDTALMTGEGETVSAWRMDELAAEIQGLEARLEALKAQEELAAESGAALAAGASAGVAGFEALTGATDETVTNLANLITKYNEVHEQISKKVKSWFGLFDEAKTSVKANVNDMMKNMQSQIDFNTSYSKNLQYLADNGLSSLGSAFQQMGADGAAYADALVTAIEDAGGATSAGGQEIIASFQGLSAGVESSQAELSSSLTNMTTSIEQAMSDWGVTAAQGVQALNQAGAAGSAAAETVNAYISGIAAGGGRARAAAASVALAAAAGFSAGGGGRGGGGPAHLAVGTDYIPYDNFPALLHKGEMVIPAKISEDLRDFLGAGKQPSSQGTPYTGGNGGGAISEVVGLLRELIVATNRPVVLDSGRLVGGIGSAMNNELGDMDVLGRRGVSLA